ncbi:MAG: dimethylarginine dimethylaminohydrolase family protein [Bradymonadaceae bacterium]
MAAVYLMSPPRRNWKLHGKANFRSRGAGEADPARARMEWSTLADSVVDAGADVLVCPPNPRRNLTGLIYTAEAGDFYRTDEGDPRFLLPNLTPEHRRPETSWIGGFFEGLGIPTEAVRTRWEGQGDAIRAVSPERIIHTWGEGADARTESDAYGEVADRLSDEHIAIRFDADPWFHGNTFLNVYRAPDPDRDPPGIALVCPDALDASEYAKLAAFVGDAEIVELTREESLGYDTNALQVGDTILAPAGLSETAARAFRRLGLRVVHIELGELFEKGGGAPVCLTNRLWGLHAKEIPAHAKWSEAPQIEAHTAQ